MAFEVDIRAWRHHLHQNPELSGEGHEPPLSVGEKSNFSRIWISKFQHLPEENS